MICVNKKNPYKFTIGFDNKNENHVKVAGILNQVGKGMTQLIVEAVLAYIGESNSPATMSLSEVDLRHMIQQLLCEELKQVADKGTSTSMINYKKEINISEDEILELEGSAVENIWSTLDAFRNIGG